MKTRDYLARLTGVLEQRHVSLGGGIYMSSPLGKGLQARAAMGD